MNSFTVKYALWKAKAHLIGMIEKPNDFNLSEDFTDQLEKDLESINKALEELNK